MNNEERCTRRLELIGRRDPLLATLVEAAGGDPTSVPLNAAPCAQATPITDPPEESDAFIATMLRAVNHGHTPTAFIPTPPEPGQGAGEGGPRGVIPVRPRTFEDVLVDALGRRGWWNEL